MIDEPVLPPAPSPKGFPSFTSGSGYNQENEIWLARKEVEQILGISHPAIVKAIKKGRFKVIETYGNGGRQYRIALSSLPAQAQIKYLQAHPELIQSAMKIALSSEAISWVKGYKQENEIWLARKEIEQILGISQPAIVKAIKKALLSLLKFFKFNRL